MVDNNRVFFECLLEQVLAERNKEGLEERSWEEALAPRFQILNFAPRFQFFKFCSQVLIF